MELTSTSTRNRTTTTHQEAELLVRVDERVVAVGQVANEHVVVQLLAHRKRLHVMQGRE